LKTMLGLRKRLGFARSGRLGTLAARLRIRRVPISRLSSGKSFIGKRKKFILNEFVDFKPM